MPPRTLIIVENLPVPFDRRVWQEALALKRGGWTVSVICPKGWGYDASYEQIDGINIYRHALPIDASGFAGFILEYSAALFWEFALSMKVLWRHGFDVVHACNPPDLIFLIGLFYKIVFGKRFLFDHHDISPELYEAKFERRGPLHRLLLFFERCTFFFADVSLATNDSFKEIAVRRGGMPADKVWVVKSYPDLDRFHRVPPDTALKNGRPFLVGYVGVMGQQDGVDGMVWAMAHLVKDRQRHDVSCVIIGDGPELASLKTLAARLDVESYIEFPGYLTGSRLLTYLSTVDVGVIPDPPNVYNDKISMNKVFEYMSLGIPFVQYDVAEGSQTAGDAALVARGTDGRALGEALLELIDDPDRRRAMGAIGKARAARDFRWDEQVLRLLAAYDAALGRPSSVRRHDWDRAA